MRVGVELQSIDYMYTAAMEAVIVFCLIGAVIAALSLWAGFALIHRIGNQPMWQQFLMGLALLLCLAGFALPTLCIGCVGTAVLAGGRL
ncbi:hypothetical protein LBMAG53_07310 [Planctomycetota bacterium]|nr:hypothetical protein LBMAG53_07310 [Planctomycetota bacterium]